MNRPSIVAVDVGNSRTKFGLFNEFSSPFPQPRQVLELPAQTGNLDELNAWLAPHAVDELHWIVGSVNRPAAARVVDWLRDRPAPPALRLLAAIDLPLMVDLPRPDMVGIDRLLAAVAANRLRGEQQGAVIVDLGTAITVDLVSPQGAFLGGAILPGLGISARAMHAFTDALPLVEMPSLGEVPQALGRSTTEAMQAGLFWGAVGGVRELIARLTESFDPAPAVFLTGGAAESVARLLTPSARFLPNLTLSGIVVATVE